MRPVLPPETRLGAFRGAAWLTLAAEQITGALWPFLTAAALWASFALLGLPGILPVWLYLGLMAAGIGALIWRLRRQWPNLRLPGWQEAERRLERDSGLRHLPFATLRDRPAGGAAQAAVWQLHQARARAAIARLRLQAPDARLADADPFALRAAAALLLAASLFAAGPQAQSRLLAAVWPTLHLSLPPPPPALQAWIQPPAYTGLPPVFLSPAGGEVTVPVGSRLTISITGAGSRPRVFLADTKLLVESLARESFQTVATLREEGELRVRGRFSALAGWTLHLLPNEKPQAHWARLPGRAGTSLATLLPWQTEQRWGVASLQAELRPKGHPELPALRVPLPLPGSPKKASGEARPDLSANPYAGLTVTGMLQARDVSGQTGESEPTDFVLPGRTFHHPLARAIAELRRRLALHPDQTDQTADELSALAEAPIAPPVPGLSPSGAVLNMAATAALLSGKPTNPRVVEAQARLYTLALALDGALPDAAANALEQAREDLRRSLRDSHLSPKELHDKLQALRQALNQRLDEMARQAMKQGALQKFDPKTQHLSSNAIDRTIQKLERALQEGRMEDARQAMAQLNRLMDQLKNAHILTPQEAQQQQEQAKRGRQQKGAVQDMVQRETTLLDHAQARAPRNSQMPLAPDVGRQMLMPPNLGTEDPVSPPNDLSQTEPPQAQADPGEAGQNSDARTQRALARALDALKQGLAQSGHKAPAAFDDAANAMKDAAGALSRHDDPPARDAIGRAIAALQQGGQSMSREQQGEGGSEGMQLSLQPGGQPGQGGGSEEGEDSYGDGHSNLRKDPFGRQVDGSGAAADDPSLRVPDQMEEGRSRAIQEELRRRGADRGRSKSELDYIGRLLKPF